MKRQLTRLIFCLYVLFFAACRKETSAPIPERQETDTKITEWLDSQKSIDDSAKNSKILRLKESLEFSKLWIENIKAGENFIIIPASNAIKSTLVKDQNSKCYLVLMLDLSGKIRNGNVVQYASGNGPAENIPVGLFNKFYNNQAITTNFRITYLNLVGRPLFEFNYQKGKIKEYSVANKKAMANESGKSQEVCLEYYWNTYVNGILVSSEYLGTFCAPEVEEGGGSGGGSGGGGGGVTQNVDFSSSESEDDPEDALGAPPITYTHTFTLQYANDDVINVIRYPVTASPMVAVYTGSTGKITTRSLTLFGQWNSWTPTSYNHGWINWSCLVFANYVYLDGSPSRSQQWSHSNTKVY